MLKENYWFQIFNNENSLLVGYVFKLYENKSSQCALSHITRRNDFSQVADSASWHLHTHSTRTNSQGSRSDQARLPPPFPRTITFNLSFCSQVTKFY